VITELRHWIATQRELVADDLHCHKGTAMRAHAEGFADALRRLEEWLARSVSTASGSPARCRCDGAPVMITRTLVAAGVVLVTTSCRCGRPVAIKLDNPHPERG